MWLSFHPCHCRQFRFAPILHRCLTPGLCACHLARHYVRSVQVSDTPPRWSWYSGFCTGCNSKGRCTFQEQLYCRCTLTCRLHNNNAKHYVYFFSLNLVCFWSSIMKGGVRGEYVREVCLMKYLNVSIKPKRFSHIYQIGKRFQIVLTLVCILFAYADGVPQSTPSPLYIILVGVDLSVSFSPIILLFSIFCARLSCVCVTDVSTTFFLSMGDGWSLVYMDNDML